MFFSSYYLSGKIDAFFCKSTLYINGLSNSEQFDSMCLDYVYQIVGSVIFSENTRIIYIFLTLQV